MNYVNVFFILSLFKIYFFKFQDGESKYNILRNIGDVIDYYNKSQYITYLIDLTKYSVGDNITYYYLNRDNNPNYNHYTYTYWSFLNTDDLDEISNMNLKILDNSFQTWDKEFRFSFEKKSEDDKMVFFRMNANDIYIKLYPIAQIIKTNITININSDIPSFYKILKIEELKDYTYIILKVNNQKK